MFFKTIVLRYKIVITGLTRGQSLLFTVENLFHSSEAWMRGLKGRDDGSRVIDQLQLRARTQRERARLERR